MNWRSPKLLNSIKDAPCCFACDRPNIGGSIVAAHSNQGRDGKGKGIKAHDYRIAALCNSCHSLLDQGNSWTLAEKREVFESAHRRTIGWLIENGILEVK